MSAAFAPVPTLYDRFDEMATLLASLEALAGGECPPDLEASLEEDLREAISGTREKIDRTSAVLSAFEVAEDHAAKEIARLHARQVGLAKQRERLEGYVISVLTAAGVQKFDGHTSTLALRKNPPSIVIEGEVSAEYMRTPESKPPVAAPDKALIKSALSNGLLVQGARLAQTIRLVRS